MLIADDHPSRNGAAVAALTRSDAVPGAPVAPAVVAAAVPGGVLAAVVPAVVVGGGGGGGADVLAGGGGGGGAAALVVGTPVGTGSCAVAVTADPDGGTEDPDGSPVAGEVVAGPVVLLVLPAAPPPV